MNPWFIFSIPTLAVSAIYYIWKAYFRAQQRLRAIRDRVTCMLWVAANQRRATRPPAVKPRYPSSTTVPFLQALFPASGLKWAPADSPREKDAMPESAKGWLVRRFVELLICTHRHQRMPCSRQAILSFPVTAYPARQEAIAAAQEAMRARFGAEVRLDPVPSLKKTPTSFRVLDGRGHHLESFGVFRTRTGKWAWQEANPRS
jgi:hypothetical protein